MQVGAVLSEATHGVSAWVSSFIFKTNLDIFYSCHDSFLAYHGPHWYSLLVLLGALPAFQDPQPPILPRHGCLAGRVIQVLNQRWFAGWGWPRTGTQRDDCGAVEG